MTTTQRITAAAIAVLSSAGSVSGQSGERAILESVQAAHKSTRELMRTSSCRVNFTNTIRSERSPTPVQQSCSGRFWHSVDAIRGQVAEGENLTDYVWTQSVRRSVSRLKDQ